MATDTVATNARLTAIVRARLQDLSAGATCSILSIAYSLSYATLVFSGPLSPWLGYGVAVTFLSTAIAALVIGLRSSLPFAVAGPDSPTSAVMAAFVAAFVGQMVAEGATEHLLERAIIVMAFSTAATGAVLLALGITHAGRAIRFVPFSGDRRISRSDWMAHRHGCYASDDGCVCHRWYCGRAFRFADR
jgi:SulP family sulfate permease